MKTWIKRNWDRSLILGFAAFLYWFGYGWKGVFLMVIGVALGWLTKDE